MIVAMSVWTLSRTRYLQENLEGIALHLAQTSKDELIRIRWSNKHQGHCEKTKQNMFLAITANYDPFYTNI